MPRGTGVMKEWAPAQTYKGRRHFRLKTLGRILSPTLAAAMPSHGICAFDMGGTEDGRKPKYLTVHPKYLLEEVI